MFIRTTNRTSFITSTKSSWFTRSKFLIASGETLVGADSTLLGAGTWLQMQEELASGGLSLVDVGLNLIDQVWTDKPEDIVSGMLCC